MNANRMFWGLIIVLFGLFWLLSNFGVLPINFWQEIWKLWPLILIFWGISLLTSKSPKGGTFFAIITAIILVAAIILFGWIYNPRLENVSKSQNISEDLISSVQTGLVNLKYGAAELNIAGYSEKLIEGSAQTIGQITVNRSQSSSRQEVTVSQDVNGPIFWNNSNKKSVIQLKLTNKIPLELNIDTGASKFNLDLEQNRISDLKLNCGASNGDIRIGDLEEEVKIDVSSGASSFNLYVPQNFALRIKNKSGLSGNNFSSLGLNKDGENWTSDGYNTASKKIDIVFSSGVSSLNISRY